MGGTRRVCSWVTLLVCVSRRRVVEEIGASKRTVNRVTGTGCEGEAGGGWPVAYPIIWCGPAPSSRELLPQTRPPDGLALGRLC